MRGKQRIGIPKAIFQVFYTLYLVFEIAWNKRTVMIASVLFEYLYV